MGKKTWVLAMYVRLSNPTLRTHLHLRYSEARKLELRNHHFWEMYICIVSAGLYWISHAVSLLSLLCNFLHIPLGTNRSSLFIYPMPNISLFEFQIYIQGITATQSKSFGVSAEVSWESAIPPLGDLSIFWQDANVSVRRIRTHVVTSYIMPCQISRMDIICTLCNNSCVQLVIPTA